MSFSAPEGRLRKPPDLGRQEPVGNILLMLGVPVCPAMRRSSTAID